MKKLLLLVFGVTALSFSSYAQADQYNLKSQNLHKRVVKTIEHGYTYHEKSGGFVKSSVTINSYNDDGNLTQKYYVYNSTYSGSTTTTETMYHYNSDNQLTRTEDISAKKGSYSFHYEFTYDNKGRLTKKESVYKSGTRYVYNYFYDNKGRLIREEYLGSNGNVSSRSTYTYSGRKKTKVYKSYDKNGNVSATYTSYYKNDQLIRFVTQSKYSNSDSTYRYDRNDNMIATEYKNKSNSSTTYHYEYDNRDNWVKKYHKSSGKYHYFYFREIIFNNGKTTGSTNFDRNFINKHGNFANVSVVNIVPTKNTTTNNTTTNNNTTTTTYSNSDMPVFRQKNYIFNYVNLNKKVNRLNGEASIIVKDNDRMSKNATVEFVYKFGGKTYRGDYTVISYLNLKEKGYHFWSLKSKTKNATIAFSIQHKKKYIQAKDMYLAAMINISQNGKSTGFYLEE
ncbi:MAG: hypothetical protein HWD85_09800 [Flavobacteriaceae bacterium]|nr:hypothetical protein [Flavobacteriaceae bacterium]